MKLTRGRIAHDLKQSPFEHLVSYANFYITYKFSSNLYRTKFIERLKENRKTINDSLSNRFGIEIEEDVLCDLKLYKDIEKRGFLIFYKGQYIECLDDAKITGSKISVKS